MANLVPVSHLLTTAVSIAVPQVLEAEETDVKTPKRHPNA